MHRKQWSSTEHIHPRTVHPLVRSSRLRFEQASGWYHADEIDTAVRLHGTLTLKSWYSTHLESWKPVLVADNTGCTGLDTRTAPFVLLLQHGTLAQPGRLTCAIHELSSVASHNGTFSTLLAPSIVKDLSTAEVRQLAGR
jgi:hypothetical protein